MVTFHPSSMGQLPMENRQLPSVSLFHAGCKRIGDFFEMVLDSGFTY